MMKSLIFVMLVITFGCIANAQSGLYTRASLQLATESEVYLSSFQPGLGIGKNWPSGWGVLLEYYRFSDTWDDTTPDCPAEGYLKQQTVALMGSYHFKKTNNKGFYIMGGLAIQARRSEYLNIYGDHTDNRNFLTGAFEFGHRWPLKKSSYGISASMKFTGPLSYSYDLNIPNNEAGNVNGSYDTYEQSVTEFITQLSFGVVLDRTFVTGATKRKK